MRLYRTLPELKKERHLALWRKALRARWSPEDIDLERGGLALGADTRDALTRILTPVLMGEQAGLYSITTMVQIMGQSPEELRRVDFDPVFNHICGRILEDEARHLAFDHVFLEDRLAGDDEAREAQRRQLRARLDAVLAYVPPILSALGPDIRRLGLDADDFYGRLRDDTTRRLERSIAGHGATRVVAVEPHARESA